MRVPCSGSPGCCAFADAAGSDAETSHTATSIGFEQRLWSMADFPGAGVGQYTDGAVRNPTIALMIEWNDGPIMKTKLNNRTTRYMKR